jgi:hypothetical protein
LVAKVGGEHVERESKSVTGQVAPVHDGCRRDTERHLNNFRDLFSRGAIFESLLNMAVEAVLAVQREGG